MNPQLIQMLLQAMLGQGMPQGPAPRPTLAPSPPAPSPRPPDPTGLARTFPAGMKGLVRPGGMSGGVGG